MASQPSAFVRRLRQFLRSRRLTSVSQIGTDRILELQFSDGQYRLFFEFFAGGNIILTDKELSTLALLRIIPGGSEQEELRVGLKYVLTNKQNYLGVPRLTLERVKESLTRSLSQGLESDGNRPKKWRKKRDDVVRKALSTSFHEFPPALIEHCLRVSNSNPPESVEGFLNDEGALQQLLLTLNAAKEISDHLGDTNECKGFIVAKVRNPVAGVPQDCLKVEIDKDQLQNFVYEDFQPFSPEQFKEDATFTILEFQGFNKTVDEFFSSVESQKLESRITEREEHASRKLEAAKQDHEKRLGGLQQVQELNVRRAQAIESNLERVQEATSAVNSLIAQSIGWPEIARMIEMEQNRGNPVAELIHLPLKLYENSITLLLSEGTYEDEPDFEGEETDSDFSDSEEDEKILTKSTKSDNLNGKLAVDVDLALSPWSNARQYYDQRRTAADKEMRTLQASARALKSTEAKIKADLKKGLKQEKDIMRPQRRAFWFEKFLYFISSEGYLVLGGKDVQQNEILYAKHLKKGDVYVHADLSGASTVIIKNTSGRSGDPIPPSTLSQAGSLAVCTSVAWDLKAVMSAWWVPADQISKTGSGGEYLQAGIFHVKGSKNFLPPAQLLLGFGVMFKISEKSKPKHLKHRIVKEASLERQNADSRVNENIQLEAQDIAAAQIPESEDRFDPVSKEPSEGVIEEPPESYSKVESSSVESSGESDDESGNLNPLQTYHIPQQDPIDEILTDQKVSSDDENIENEEQLQPEIKLAESEPCEPNVSRHGDDPLRTEHLSAKDRRTIHRGNQAKENASTAMSDPDAASEISHPESQANAARKVHQVRGKHGKRNKIKNKYAGQDEEDRALAMRLLGSTTAQEKAKEDAATKVNKEEGLAAAKERRRKQHELAAEKGKKAEELRRTNFEASAEAVGDEDDEDEQGTDLDAFVGTPLPGDEILDALVMCGPWEAIGRKCKWRAKIQPGTVKKGKAVKEILSAWTSELSVREKRARPTPPAVSDGDGDGDDGTTMAAAAAADVEIRKKEAELIQGFRETEAVGLVPVGKMRLVMGGGGGDSKGGGKGKGKAGNAGNKGNRGGKGSKRR